MSGNDLVVVGMGISVWDHATPQARRAIEDADQVLYLTHDPLTERWVRKFNPAAQSLGELYDQHEQRDAVYAAMVDRILDAVRGGDSVCVSFYGHPGVYADAGHRAIERARAEGYTAVMYPGISAADCLYADLGLDPGWEGCQSYEATAFLDRRRRFDTATSLILWQIGAVGEATTSPQSPPRRLGELADLLILHYGSQHEVVIYEAADTPLFPGRIERVALEALAEADLTLTSTLYVPPVADSSSSTASATASS